MTAAINGTIESWLFAAGPAIAISILAVVVHWADLRAAMASRLKSPVFKDVAADILVQLSVVGGLVDHAARETDLFGTASRSGTEPPADDPLLLYGCWAFACWCFALMLKQRARIADVPGSAVPPMQWKVAWSPARIFRSQEFKELSADVLIQLSVVGPIVDYAVDRSQRAQAWQYVLWAAFCWYVALQLKRRARAAG